MPTKTQETMWKQIQRDAKAAGLSDGAFLTQNPARLEAYQKEAARPANPLTGENPANRVLLERAQQLATARHISRDEALVSILQAEPKMYAAWKAQRDERLGLPDGATAANTSRANGGDGGGATGPLSPAELLDLQRLANRLGYDASLSDLDGAGWEVARALWDDLLEEQADYASASEAPGHTRRFAEEDRDFQAFGEVVTLLGVEDDED